MYITFLQMLHRMFQGLWNNSGQVGHKINASRLRMRGFPFVRCNEPQSDKSILLNFGPCWHHQLLLVSVDLYSIVGKKKHRVGWFQKETKIMEKEDYAEAIWDQLFRIWNPWVWEQKLCSYWSLGFQAIRAECKCGLQTTREVYTGN